MDWSEEYAIGVEQIDEQHKGFFRFVNELAAMGGADETAVHEKMEFLKSYALEHFDAEEAFMEIHESPRLDEHAQMHVDFIRQYSDLARAYRAGAGAAAELDRIRSMAGAWLASHITRADADYARFVREQAAGK